MSNLFKPHLPEAFVAISSDYTDHQNPRQNQEFNLKFKQLANDLSHIDSRPASQAQNLVRSAHRFNNINKIKQPFEKAASQNSTTNKTVSNWRKSNKTKDDVQTVYSSV